MLTAVHTLEDSNLEAIRAAVGLESKLQTLVGERLGEVTPPPPPRQHARTQTSRQPH